MSTHNFEITRRDPLAAVDTAGGELRELISLKCKGCGRLGKAVAEKVGDPVGPYEINYLNNQAFGRIPCQRAPILSIEFQGAHNLIIERGPVLPVRVVSDDGAEALKPRLTVKCRFCNKGILYDISSAFGLIDHVHLAAVDFYAAIPECTP